jgi:hypothetical protein
MRTNKNGINTWKKQVKYIAETVFSIPPVEIQVTESDSWKQDWNLNPHLKGIRKRVGLDKQDTAG